MKQVREVLEAVRTVHAVAVIAATKAETAEERRVCRNASYTLADLVERLRAELRKK